MPWSVVCRGRGRTTLAGRWKSAAAWCGSMMARAFGRCTRSEKSCGSVGRRWLAAPDTSPYGSGVTESSGSGLGARRTGQRTLRLRPSSTTTRPRGNSYAAGSGWPWLQRTSTKRLLCRQLGRKATFLPALASCKRCAWRLASASCLVSASGIGRLATVESLSAVTRAQQDRQPRSRAESCSPSIIASWTSATARAASMWPSWQRTNSRSARRAFQY
mmetsp:Transcript_21525/g.60963  ORF Transcript_21525/g.60963 Transcript_21525/m.60963 type:complete len:217 (+) Transcript_21525:409-1059(+)